MKMNRSAMKPVMGLASPRDMGRDCRVTAADQGMVID